MGTGHDKSETHARPASAVKRTHVSAQWGIFLHGARNSVLASWDERLDHRPSSSQVSFPLAAMYALCMAVNSRRRSRTLRLDGVNVRRTEGLPWASTRS